MRALLCLVLAVPACSINPCEIDPNACVPLEDFEVNCTCILTHGRPINASDSVYMFLLGHRIPLHLFRQVEMSQLFRKKLKHRIPSSLNFDSSLEFPESIARTLHIEENMLYQTIAFLDPMPDETEHVQILKTQEAKNFSRWCAEGECNTVVDETMLHNVSAGVYTHAADILQVVELRGTSVIAASSVKAEFNLPQVQSMICDTKCTKFQPGDGSMCRKHCTQRMRYDYVSVVGQLKRDFQMFVRAAAAKNLRDKYHKYLK